MKLPTNVFSYKFTDETGVADPFTQERVVSRNAFMRIANESRNDLAYTDIGISYYMDGVQLSYLDMVRDIEGNVVGVAREFREFPTLGEAKEIARMNGWAIYVKVFRGGHWLIKFKNCPPVSVLGAAMGL